MKIFQIISSKKIQKVLFWILLSAILSIALFLRIYKLDASSFWLDELHTAHRVARFTIPELYIYWPIPLHEICLRLLSFGGCFSSEILYRLWSVLCGVLSVYWLYRLGKRLGAPEAGLAAAILLAFFPYHIYYSQEARYYAQTSFLFLVTCEIVIVWIRNGRWISALGVALGACVTIFTHLYSVIMFPGLVLFSGIVWVIRFAKRPGKFKALIWICQAFLIIFIFYFCIPPAAIKYSIKSINKDSQYSKLVSSSNGKIISHLISFPKLSEAKNSVKSWFFASIPRFQWFYFSCIIGVLIGLFFKYTQQISFFTGILLYCGLWTQKIVPQNPFFPRYVISFLPIFLLGVGLGGVVVFEFIAWLIKLVFFHRKLSNNVEKIFSILRKICPVLFVILLLLSSFNSRILKKAYARRAANWRKSGKFINERSPKKIVLFAPPFPMSKCLYMYLLGITGNDVDCLKKKKLLLQRGISEVATQPFALWLQLRRRVNHFANSNLYAGRVGPVNIIGTTTTCSNYMQAFEIISPSEPYYQRELKNLLRKFKSLPPKLSFDIGTISSRPYLARGWSHDEGEGIHKYCWSEDTEASIAIGPIFGKTFDLQINVRSYKPQEIQIWGNQTLLTNWICKTILEQITWRGLPNVFTNNLNFLSFVIPDARHSDYVDFGMDPRRLGIALEKLSITPSSTRMISSNGKIDIGKNNDSNFLLNGWSHVENWLPNNFPFRWCDGKTASLAIEIASTQTIEKIRWKCLPFQPKNTLPIVMKLFVNDNQVWEDKLTNIWKVCETVIPPSSGSLKIDFQMSNAYNPKKFGLGEDDRDLSVGFDYIEFLQ